MKAMMKVVMKSIMKKAMTETQSHVGDDVDEIKLLRALGTSMGMEVQAP